MTLFALFACAATVIEIATDLIAWDGCSRCVPRGVLMVSFGLVLRRGRIRVQECRVF